MKTWRKLGLAASIAVAAAAGVEGQIVDAGLAWEAQATGSGRGSGRGSGSAEGIYRRGMKALDDRQWDQAINAFGELAGSPRADAALYWKAYALNKANRRAEALSAIAQLTKEHPGSRWVSDARALELEVRQSAGQRANPDAEADEDLKLMAINSLMHSDPEQAIPQLERVLKGNFPPKYKERALFVLSQTGSPRARQIVADIARGGGNPDLQLKAVRNLGLFGGRESRKTLEEIYRSSSDIQLKRAILQGFMVSGDREVLLSVARDEKSPDLRRHAIQQLGVMGAQDELWKMYANEQSPEMKKAIVQGMFVGGNADRLIELARTEKDPALRRIAIQNLGLMGGKTADALLGLYTSDSDKTVRKQVLQSLFLQGNSKALVEIARKESDPELKRDAVRHLSLMDSKEGRELMMEILK